MSRIYSKLLHLWVLFNKNATTHRFRLAAQIDKIIANTYILKNAGKTQKKGPK